MSTPVIPVAPTARRLPFLTLQPDGSWRFPDEYAPPSVGVDAAAARLSADDAETAAEDAAGRASDAAGSALAADQSRVAAAQRATEADQARAAAVTAKGAAETARTGAEAARDATNGQRQAAETAAGSAEAARQGAVTERQGAETARGGAETARTGSQAAQAAAEKARNETIVGAAARTDMTGAVTITQAQGRSAYLNRRLTGNADITVSAGVAGEAYSLTLDLQQDATGGRVVRLLNVAVEEGIVLPITAGANARSLVYLLWNGYVWSATLGGRNFIIPTAWIV